jgi:superfamily II DNA or RNA helicase
MRRRFNAGERAVLYLAANGRCEKCGAELQPGWHADHITPYSAGGVTNVINGQALCPDCNLKKGSNVTDPRIWQRRATDLFYALPSGEKDFLVSATPGAGKTWFALDLASDLLAQRTIQRVIVVVPTDGLREQWAEEAGKRGLSLKPVAEGGDYKKAGYQGCVVTYQQLLGVGAGLMENATQRPTLVILDEIHHAGDNKSWGEALRRASGQARYRLALTGTPWRRDNRSPIPFVNYDKNGKVKVNYAYEYGQAVTDGVCRRIEFHAYDGTARWIDPARSRRESSSAPGSVSVEFSAKIGADMDEADVSAALDALYDPKHQWMPEILVQANTMLDELRTEVPDAAGLVVCERQWHAHQYAELIEKITGEKPPVIISDPKEDPDSKEAKAQIEKFKKSRARWIVAVKMISEGIDIKRLAVGVYASKTQTPLFFRQVVGRFVRTRPNEEFNARLLIPAVPELLKHAAEIEDELRHELDLAEEEERKAREGSSGGSCGELDLRQPTGTSEPIFTGVIFGGEKNTPEEIAEAEVWCRERGIPTLYAANVVDMVRTQKAAPTQEAAAPQPPEEAVVPRHKREKLLRGEIKTLVNKYAHRMGWEPREVNAELMRAGHPKRPDATVEELEEIRQTVLRWMAER